MESRHIHPHNSSSARFQRTLATPYTYKIRPLSINELIPPQLICLHPPRRPNPNQVPLQSQQTAGRQIKPTSCGNLPQATFLASASTASVFSLPRDGDTYVSTLVALSITVVFSVTALTMSAMLLLISNSALVPADAYVHALSIANATAVVALVAAVCSQLWTVSIGVSGAVGASTLGIAVMAVVGAYWGADLTFGKGVRLMMNGQKEETVNWISNQ
ncbi:hypothetical protein M427DRAFT_457225 [Gonapodya prolifera JEL478]|uniref:Uncharacterized protein n=1 Tax=Gonapodya prolifera (strain JEL478) TaxID=1344416 RepID=A0A139A2F8_GONPJ|nr:hypothetical protein M427DRAFT_457225 [Gonapodya prolifera JEL478]|eukprot:KXS10924.1 hypothetical protein M427DRAFT_457225 [Gonapodya prolifera JEL478]